MLEIITRILDFVFLVIVAYGIRNEYRNVRYNGKKFTLNDFVQLVIVIAFVSAITYNIWFKQ